MLHPRTTVSITAMTLAGLGIGLSDSRSAFAQIAPPPIESLSDHAGLPPLIRDGVDAGCPSQGEPGWDSWSPQPGFDTYQQGEYLGPPRDPHQPEYRLRVGDQLSILYLKDRRPSSQPYRLSVGDEVLIESFSDPEIRRGDFQRGIVIQPDGTVTLRLVGQVQAAGLTVDQFRALVAEKYGRFHQSDRIDVTPIRVNTLLEDLVAAAGGQGGFVQPQLARTVAPDGTIQLPKLGSLVAQGMTLGELKTEVNLRYGEFVAGLEVDPALVTRAPTRIFVVGEVAQPGEKALSGPTTALGGIALAGGHRLGANLRQVVVFRRFDDWRLVSTMLDLRGAMLGKRPQPSDEIWLRDGDVIIVPATPIERFDQWAEQVFTNGLYRVIPFAGPSLVLGDQP